MQKKLLEGLERKQRLDTEAKEQLRSIQSKAVTHDIAAFMKEVQSKQEAYEEEKKLSTLE